MKKNNTEDVEIVKAETEVIDVSRKTGEDLFIEGLNDKITEMIENSLKQINIDRKRSEETFKELRDIVLSGDTDPDVLRELNKSQEIIATTTDQVIKVLAQLARIRSGDTKIQIAQINEAKKEALGENSGKVTGKDILEALEEMEKENILDEDG